jgi:hypothetical protein
MRTPDLQATLTVSGFECLPEQVSSVLGVTPTDTWLEGDPIGQGTRRWQFRGWRLRSPLAGDEALSDHIAWLLQAVPGAFDRLRSVTESWELELAVTAFVYDAVPALHLPAAQMARLAALNAAVDIDVILLRDGGSQ